MVKMIKNKFIFKCNRLINYIIAEISNKREEHNLSHEIYF